MYLLGYDIGSSSVKASLINAETGKCVASAFYPKTEAEIIAVRSGWAEQNPESWWEYLKLATAAVLNESKITPADIRSIGMPIPHLAFPMTSLLKNGCMMEKSSIFSMMQTTTPTATAAQATGSISKWFVTRAVTLKS